MKTQYSKKLTILTIILLIVSFIIVGGIIYLYINDMYDKDKQQAEKIEMQDKTEDENSDANGENESSVCVYSLTDSDNLDLQTWKTYTNDTYGYSFKYPETWVTDKNDPSWLILKSDEADIVFQVRIGKGAGFDFDGFKEKSSTSITVACKNAVRVYYVGDTAEFPDMVNKESIYTSFTKSGTPYFVKMSYTHVGASITGDIIDAYDLILKTIEFI